MPSWAERAAKANHNVTVCPCVGCRAFRGDPPAPRKKGKIRRNKPRQRGYLHLNNADDSRVLTAAIELGLSKAELCRRAVLIFLSDYEKEKAEVFLAVEDLEALIGKEVRENASAIE